MNILEFDLQAFFDAPEGEDPLALDMGSMGKGQIWINGYNIGRYWTAKATGDCNGCKYNGTYRATTCQVGCDQPTQRWYLNFPIHFPKLLKEISQFVSNLNSCNVIFQVPCPKIVGEENKELGGSIRRNWRRFFQNITSEKISHK